MRFILNVILDTTSMIEWELCLLCSMVFFNLFEFVWNVLAYYE
jgi:hypothetical protein